jgi:hypothetical protein
MAKTPRSALSGGQALLLETSLNSALPGGLEGICAILNGDESSDLLCKEFRRLIRAWQASGPNLRKMLLADKSLAARAQRGSAFLVPTDNGNGYLGWEPMGLGNQLSWSDMALRYFLYLVVQPQWQKLGGPCKRPGCGCYYVKKRASQKAYCSRRCGNAVTATAATRKKRDEKHADKLHRARTALRKWIKTRTQLDWKDWVAKNEQDLSPRFLTRAVNNGELKVPAKKG